GAEVSAARCRRRLVRHRLEDPEVKKRRQPENDVKNQGAEKLREHDLPVANRRRHERLDSAELKFLREQSHRDEREDEDEGEPEENRIEESFLDRIADRFPVHERELEIKIRARDEEKKEQDDVRDRRVEVAADFAGKEGVKFSHDDGSPG